MKKILFLILFVIFSFSALAQKQYTISGDTYELKTEVNGTIDLLWNIFDRKYRYFVRKDSIITELVNTKGNTKKFQKEYKVTLNNLTKGSGLSTDKVNLTLYSLRNFINEYNSLQDPDYVATNNTVVQSLLLIFGGITNSPFIENINNTNNILIGAEIEVFEATNLPRHSVYFLFQHRFQSDAFKYSQTQFGLGYRFRFLKKKTFSVYANVLAATYNFNKQTITFFDFDVFLEKEYLKTALLFPLFLELVQTLE